MPNGPAQERVIAEALAHAGVAPADVDYLEAHGAGSSMGDAIEVQAAAAVYGRGRAPERPLLIGSVKNNIGHLEPAAGIAGLIKTVLAMNRRAIPPHLHVGGYNPNLDWERLPVRVTTELTAWPPGTGRPPRAGVSALGISGANAHVVVEGHGAPPGGAETAAAFAPMGAPRRVAADLPDAQPNRVSGGERSAVHDLRLLPLSGKSDAALRALARRYLAWLEERGDALSGDAAERLLADMAWTASVGRSHFAHRAAVVFADAGSLRARLQAVAEGGAASPGVDQDGAVAAAAAAYEAGGTVSFASLFAGETRRRISIPGYPFQRRRHWIRMG